MYFDCASRTDDKGRPTLGVGIVFITPEGNMIPLRAFTDFVGVKRRWTSSRDGGISA